MIEILQFESTDGENARATLEVRVGNMQLSLTKEAIGGITATRDALVDLAYHLRFEADISDIDIFPEKGMYTSKARVKCRFSYHRPKVYRGQASDPDGIKAFFLAHIDAYERIIERNGFSYE